MYEKSLRFLTTIILTKLYVKDGIFSIMWITLLSIISIRGEVLTHTTSLTRHLFFIEVPVPVPVPEMKVKGRVFV